MDVLGSLSGSSVAAESDELPVLRCSRKGCLATARWEILWNNPKIHAPERRKSWLACDEHRVYLQDFLKARSFWKQTRPLEASEC